MIIGVSTITKNGLRACQISGATNDWSTKSRAKNESDIPFWWNENQKKIAMNNTANNAIRRCLISAAIAAFSSAEYSTAAEASFLAGVGKIRLLAMKITNEIAIAATEAMNEK